VLCFIYGRKPEKKGNKEMQERQLIIELLGQAYVLPAFAIALPIVLVIFSGLIALAIFGERENN
jgi:hypothetical protein